jgi:Na+-driven multidrug efflux pump
MKYLTWASSAVLLVLGAMVFPVAPLISGLYSTDLAVVTMATQLFRMSLVVSPLCWAWSFLLPAGLKGAGDVKFTMVSAIIGMWTFRIGTGWLFAIPMGLGVPGIWLGMYADWVVRGILFGLRLRGGKWKSMQVLKGDLGDKPKVATIEV